MHCCNKDRLRSHSRRWLRTFRARYSGNLEKREIRIYPEITDDAMFESRNALENAICNGKIPELLHTYFTTGKADTLIDLPVYHKRLLDFLTQTPFEKKNVILATHDIIIAGLLFPLKIYPFSMNDWIGYIQGAALFLSKEDGWTVAYLVPDKEKRKEYALFI